MILLSGHSLTPARKVPLEAMGLQLSERDSTATITPADMTDIGINSWLRDDTDPGNGIVWRVKSIRQAFDTNTPSVQLEHAINTLADKIIFGEITPKEITGSSSATTCTAKQAIDYILGLQSDWVLYSFDYASVSNPYKFNGETLLDAVGIVSDSLADAWWSYDMSVYPFRLNIKQKQSGVDSILRPGRNLRTISKTIDRSGMYTRFYPIGKDDLHIDTDYVERNTSTYGVVSRVETDSSIDSKAELTRWANERLSRHAEPVVTIDVEGLELAAATGENMDRLTLGRLCDVYMPEFSVTIEERITALSYPDKVNQPEMVKITLANKRTDVTKIIADSLKKSGSSSRSYGRQSKEDHAFMEDMDDSIGMVVGYTDATGKFIRAGQIALAINTDGDPTATAWINADHVNISATTTAHALAGEVEYDANGRLVIKNAGGMYVKRTESGVTAYYGVWDQGNVTGGMIVDKVNGSTSTYITGDHVNISATNTVHTLAGEMEVDLNGKLIIKSGGGMYVRKTIGGVTSEFGVYDNNNLTAGVIATIVNGESSTMIKGTKIRIGTSDTVGTWISNKTYLDDVTANYIDGKISTLATLHGIAASFSGNITAGGSLIGYQVYVGSSAPYTNISDGIAAVQVVPTSNEDEYQLQYKKFSDASWQNGGTFERGGGGYDEGYDEGYDAGWDDGYDWGYYDGYIDGESAGGGGGEIVSSDIQIGNYTEGSAIEPSGGTAAPAMASAIKQALSHGHWFSFTVTVDGTSASKTYKLNLT